MQFDTLGAWLRWQEGLHPNAIDLGLERVRAVWQRLGSSSPPFPLITVAGTNGKGSCAAMLEAVYDAAGYRTCCYTSPHLLRYNERIRIDRREVSDADLCAAFERVENARGTVTLTYFEFGTLAALDLFVRAAPDVAILEVGLGGRLDAVNLLDADVAVVTSIGRDHMAWLGEELESIAAEKAGIFRPGRPAVVGHRNPAGAILARAEQLDSPLYVLGRDFDWKQDELGWHWLGPGWPPTALPSPALRGAHQYDNAATAFMAISCLAERLPAPLSSLREGLVKVNLPGRFQVIPGDVTWILDVAHNGQAADTLAASLAMFPCRGTLYAVFGVLKDKEPAAIVAPLAERVGQWHLGETSGPRSLPVTELMHALDGVLPRDRMHAYGDLNQAMDGALAAARKGDCILVLGSFTTVEAALRQLTDQPGR